MKLKVLDLFSGIGGFSLGLEKTGGFETIGFCEIEPFCQKVLKKHWPDVPIYEDVKTMAGTIHADVITGGYPCQPFSHAGKRTGENDDRHIWPEMYRLIKAIRPRWVIAENVAGHINMGLDTVLSNLEAEGYTWGTFVIPACAVDAKHRRDRVWIVANADGKRGPQQKRLKREIGRRAVDSREDVTNTNQLNDDRCRFDSGSVFRKQSGQTKLPGSKEDVPNAGCRSGEGTGPAISRWQIPARWQPEPDVGRVATGIPRRLDRLRALGNAVVPQIPEIIGYAILEAEQ